MCFSATASFTATGITALAGVTSIASARRSRYLVLSVAPLFFALQQAAEGVLWRIFDGDATAAWQMPATTLFLVVANVVWPIWVPLSFWIGEPDPSRRRWHRALVWLGVVVSIAYVVALISHPYTATVVGSHIAYHGGTPWRPVALVILAYPIAVVAPPLLSSRWTFRLIGVAVLVSLIVARAAYFSAAVSVWCFFAAMISGLVAVAIRRAINQERVMRPAMP